MFVVDKAREYLPISLIMSIIMLLAAVITIWKDGRDFTWGVVSGIIGGAAVIYQGVWGIVGLLAGGFLLFQFYAFIRDRNSKFKNLESLAEERDRIKSELTDVKSRCEKAKADNSTYREQIEEKNKKIALLEENRDSLYKRTNDLCAERNIFKLAHNCQPKGLRLTILWIDSDEVSLGRYLKNRFKSQGWDADIARSKEKEPQKPENARFLIRCQEKDLLEDILSSFNNYGFGRNLRAAGTTVDELEVDAEITIFPE